MARNQINYYDNINNECNDASKSIKGKSFFMSALLTLLTFIPFACIVYCLCIFFLFDQVIIFICIAVSSIFLMFLIFLANYFYYSSIYELHYNKKISFFNLFKCYLISLEGIILNIVIVIIAVALIIILNTLFYR